MLRGYVKQGIEEILQMLGLALGEMDVVGLVESCVKARLINF